MVNMNEQLCPQPTPTSDSETCDYKKKNIIVSEVVKPSFLEQKVESFAGPGPAATLCTKMAARLAQRLTHFQGGFQSHSIQD